MNLKNAGLLAITAVAAALSAAPAQASLVLVGPQDFGGTGLGAVNTILTIQSPGSSSFESGSVGRVVGNPGDVIMGDAKTGASQTQTRSLGSLGVTSAANLRVVFNALEPGGANNDILLSNLVLNIYGATGNVLFTSGTFTPVNFPNTFTGAGNSGFVFRLDAAQAASAQALAFTGSFASNLLGLTAAANNATGGFETFFVANVNGGGGPPAVTPVPEPETYALMMAGLGLLGFVAKRRKRV